MGLVRIRPVDAQSVEDNFRSVNARFIGVTNFAQVIANDLSAADRQANLCFGSYCIIDLPAVG